jgi:hypothetical protein
VCCSDVGLGQFVARFAADSLLIDFGEELDLHDLELSPVRGRKQPSRVNSLSDRRARIVRGEDLDNRRGAARS